MTRDFDERPARVAAEVEDGGRLPVGAIRSPGARRPGGVTGGVSGWPTGRGRTDPWRSGCRRTACRRTARRRTAWRRTAWRRRRGWASGQAAPAADRPRKAPVGRAARLLWFLAGTAGTSSRASRHPRPVVLRPPGRVTEHVPCRVEPGHALGRTAVHVRVVLASEAAIRRPDDVRVGRRVHLQHPVVVRQWHRLERTRRDPDRSLHGWRGRQRQRNGPRLMRLDEQLATPLAALRRFPRASGSEPPQGPDGSRNADALRLRDPPPVVPARGR